MVTAQRKSTRKNIVINGMRTMTVMKKLTPMIVISYIQLGQEEDKRPLKERDKEKKENILIVVVRRQVMMMTMIPIDIILKRRNNKNLILMMTLILTISTKRRRKIKIKSMMSVVKIMQTVMINQSLSQAIRKVC